MSDYTKYLVGAEILDAKWNSDTLTLTILKDGKKQKVDLDCYGECCSTTWIESIDGFENLRGIVYECEDVGGKSESDSCGCVQYDFVKFRTEKGYVTLEFRNESNGYYSGWLDMSVKDL